MYDPEIPRDLLELRSRLETWSKTRKYIHEPVPDELRQAADAMIRRYSPCFQPLPEMIERINRQMAGWKGFFNYGYARQAMRENNHYAIERLTRHAKRRSQRPIKPAKDEGCYGFFKRIGLKSL
ncbi:MAG: hypothetical protein IPG76_20960 [Acidobacteria bacterium]|nr:hypothetical protein [Acidobacteriota bacterium]